MAKSKEIRSRDDVKLFEVPWTADLALRWAGVDRSLPRAQQVAQIRDQIDGSGLPDEAIEVLVKAGWRELLR